MEFQNRIVEHWLLPSSKQSLTWSQLPTVDPMITSRTVVSFNDELVEFLEYNWAACVGTGGEWASISRSLVEPVGVAVRSNVVLPRAQPEVRSTSDQLAAIKSAFGLSVSQLAQVLKVGRPTIYSWFDPESGPDTLRGANRQRLLELCKVADSWNALSKRPIGKHLTATLADVGSVLDLLSASPLDRACIETAFKAVASAMQESNTRVEPRSIAERLRQRGFADVPAGPMQPKGPGSA